MSRCAEVRRARPLLGTIVDIAASGPDAERAVERAFAAVERVQRLMSYHDAASELARLNRTAHTLPVKVRAWTFRVLKLSQRLSRESGGAFDATVAPRLVAWGFLPRSPGGGRSEKNATWRDVELLPGSTVRFLRALHLDLGGIAKGFAVDRAVDALRAGGCESGCVNAGGDLRVFGEDAHRVHVRHPAAPGCMARALELRDAAIATSSGYFSRKQWRGRNVSPLVDGRTRLPCDDSLSISVVAPEAACADALTKIVFAMRDDAAPLLAARGATALVLDRRGKCSLPDSTHDAP